MTGLLVDVVVPIERSALGNGVGTGKQAFLTTLYRNRQLGCILKR